MADKLKDNCTRSGSQQSASFTGSYFERTSRPIYALVFLLPFIIFYEIGTFLINTDTLSQSQVRVVAFVWLQRLLEYLGFSVRFAWVAIPFAVILILLGMHIASRKKWSVRLKDFSPMAIECLLLAVPLIVLSLVLNRPYQDQTAFAQNASTTTISNPAISLSSTTTQTHTASFLAAANNAPGIIKNKCMVDIVTGIGAGIYEELVFRLILICALMLIFQDIIGVSRKSSIIISVVIAAALFSIHHHIVLIDGQISKVAAFTWPQFTFRTIAGVYFAILFALRGFGIAAGTHTFYDIIAAVINANLLTAES